MQRHIVSCSTLCAYFITHYLSHRSNVCSSSFLLLCIYTTYSGLKKMKAVSEVRQLVAAIARKINKSDIFYHPVNICIALNGLQGMDDTVPEVRTLMTALMDKAITAEEQGLDKAGDREISMALFGKYINY